MAPVSKQKRHLQQLALESKKRATTINNILLKEKENVIFIRVQESHILDPIYSSEEERGQDSEEWSAVNAEPDSDGPADDDTDDEDWQSLQRTVS